MFLVTRPLPKATETAEALSAHGFAASMLPALRIEHLSSLPPALSAGYDIIVVTSTYTQPYLRIHLRALTHDKSQFVCVGKSSASMVAACLKDAAMALHIEVAEPQNSEGVIASHSFEDLTGKTVAILKGRDGRTSIASYLAEKQVSPDIYEVYERIGAFHESSMNQVDGHSIKCIIVTSVDIAEQVFEHFPLDWLKSKIFIVASQRIYDYVSAQGAQQLLLSKDASTASIVTCANQLKSSGVLDDKR